jgi:dipeptidyl aminopeptidase/acylaminoacyl peptidase
LFLRQYLLPKQIGLITFDFHGTGNSGGEFISLGWHEAQDLKYVMEKVLSFPEIQNNKIAIWGYSMGAVTAVLF